MKARKRITDSQIDWQGCNTPDDLCRHLAISQELRHFAKYEAGHYHIIRKYRGPDKPPRRIYAPGKHIKRVQRAIVKYVLSPVPLLSCVHSRVGCSIKTNARLHCGQECIAIFDMQDFFPSISATRVRTLFRDLGFNRYLAGLLTTLTTVDGFLQQGPPTSPGIANIIALPLDKALVSVCDQRGLHYSRYVDDITISGNRACLSGMDDIVRDAVVAHGFRYSEEKHKLMPESALQVVTGVRVNDGSLDITPEYEHQLITAIDCFNDYIAGTPTTVVEEEYERLYGRIQFCRYINRVHGDRLFDYFRKIIPARIHPAHKGKKHHQTSSSRRAVGYSANADTKQPTLAL